MIGMRCEFRFGSNLICNRRKLHTKCTMPTDKNGICIKFQQERAAVGASFVRVTLLFRLTFKMKNDHKSISIHIINDQSGSTTKARRYRMAINCFRLLCTLRMTASLLRRTIRVQYFGETTRIRAHACCRGWWRNAFQFVLAEIYIWNFRCSDGTTQVRKSIDR